MSTNPQIPLFRGVIEDVVDGRPPVHDQRPEVLESRTYRLTIPYETESLDVFLTVSNRDGRPFEFFLNCTHVALSEHLAAVSLLGSRMLRNGFPVELVAEDLLGIASPHTSHMRRGGFCPSLSALIGQTLLRHAEESAAAAVPGDATGSVAPEADGPGEAAGTGRPDTAGRGEEAAAGGPDADRRGDGAATGRPDTDGVGHATGPVEPARGGRRDRPAVASRNERT